MAKYVVLLVGHANATVTVETDETDPERILEEAWENTPSICAQCGGWGQIFSLELGDEWEPVEDEDGKPTIYKEDE